MRASLIIVDGGGSTTDVAAFDGTREIGRSSFPSCKPTAESMQTDELCRHLGTWLVTTRCALTESTLILIGMSGIWSVEERRSYLLDFDTSWSHYIGDLLPRISVISDVELVQLAALQSGSGIVLIAGTGSIALSVDRLGVQRRCGGWGPRIDDAGSGFWIGREALRSVAQMLDGRGPSTLLIRPVAAFLVADPDDVISLQNKLRATSIDRCARLAQAVLSYADEGDAVAIDIRRRAADHLAALVLAVRATVPTVEPNLVLYGSLWQNASLRNLVGALVSQAYPDTSSSMLADVCASAARALTPEEHA
jgi:N-acetylglucosamine kinase-like BadF-type ATPase